MKVLQINTVVNSGSTGRIAEDLGVVAIQNGWDSYIGYGRGVRPSASHKIAIGNRIDFYVHVLITRFFDRHGFGSSRATRNFIKVIEEINPDIIHLHNIHGYYLHIEYLFSFFKRLDKPIVWTLHDCWPFTGHCAFYSSVDCNKWQTQCNNCPSIERYPNSWGKDASKANFMDKKRIFNGVEQLQIITPSNWLAQEVKRSFLKDYPVDVIYNGIDIEVFKPCEDVEVMGKYKIGMMPYIIGVASTWDQRKGLRDFIELRKTLPTEISIVLVGLNDAQIATLPQGIVGIPRTESTYELSVLYSMALAFVNPTYSDNFPSTNIEALACGTPVITYKTGGSMEAIDANTGFVVERGDIDGLLKNINTIYSIPRHEMIQICRARAISRFNRMDRYTDYIGVYKKLLENEKP